MFEQLDHVCLGRLIRFASSVSQPQARPKTATTRTRNAIPLEPLNYCEHCLLYRLRPSPSSSIHRAALETPARLNFPAVDLSLASNVDLTTHPPNSNSSSHAWFVSQNQGRFCRCKRSIWIRMSHRPSRRPCEANHHDIPYPLFPLRSLVNPFPRCLRRGTACIPSRHTQTLCCTVFCNA